MSRPGAFSRFGLFAGEAAPGFPAIKSSKILNLGDIDFPKLRAEFKSSPFKNIEITVLRDFIEKKLADRIDMNITRIGLIEGLSEDGLEIGDILKKEKMTKAEEIKVKNAAK